MNDEANTLFDALLDLRMDWEGILEHYGQAVASHLRSGLDGGGSAPGALALIAADVVRFSAAIDQLRLCLAAVDDVLTVAEELRVASVSLGASHAQGRSAPGDGGASTSTRAPSAAGPGTRPECGQRKADETDL